MRFRLLILFLAFALSGHPRTSATQEPGSSKKSPRGENAQNVNWNGTRLLIQLQPSQWKKLLQQAQNLDPVLTVRLASPADSPPVLGKTSLRPSTRSIQFTPRFTFTPGTRLKFSLGKLYRGSYTVPAREHDRTRVVAVYPDSQKLPANILKFYVHFSGPMQKGNIYKHLSIVDLTANKKVELPFLELAEELWTRDRKRLTLFFDPGRIKRGLKPRKEMGAIFETGKKYAFRVSKNWLDEHGHPLESSFEKSFVATDDDTQTPEYQKWLIHPPKSNSLAPLVIEFGEPLDSALAERVINVRFKGKELALRETRLTQYQHAIQLLPSQPWIRGQYKVRIGSELEDLSGNRIGRVFDVELGVHQGSSDARYYQREFEVK